MLNKLKEYSRYEDSVATSSISLCILNQFQWDARNATWNRKVVNMLTAQSEENHNCQNTGHMLLNFGDSLVIEEG